MPIVIVFIEVNKWKRLRTCIRPVMLGVSYLIFVLGQNVDYISLRSLDALGHKREGGVKQITISLYCFPRVRFRRRISSCKSSKKI